MLFAVSAGYWARKFTKFRVMQPQEFRPHAVPFSIIQTGWCLRNYMANIRRHIWRVLCKKKVCIGGTKRGKHNCPVMSHVGDIWMVTAQVSCTFREFMMGDTSQACILLRSIRFVSRRPCGAAWYSPRHTPEETCPTSPVKRHITTSSLLSEIFTCLSLSSFSCYELFFVGPQKVLAKKLPKATRSRTRECCKWNLRAASLIIMQTLRFDLFVVITKKCFIEWSNYFH